MVYYKHMDQSKISFQSQQTFSYSQLPMLKIFCFLFIFLFIGFGGFYLGKKLNTPKSNKYIIQPSLTPIFLPKPETQFQFPLGKDDTVWYIFKTVVVEPKVTKYIKLSFPKKNPFVTKIESNSILEPFIIRTTTPGCFISTSGAIGRGGGNSKTIFDLSLGDYQYVFDAWSYDSTLTAHNEDWSLQFGLNSIGSDNPNFYSCVNDIKQALS